MVTDASVRVERVGRAALAKIVQASIPSLPVERVGRAALAKVVQASIPKALRRLLRFTRVTGNSETRIAAAPGSRVEWETFIAAEHPSQLSCGFEWESILAGGR
jgi:hypothetical protein